MHKVLGNHKSVSTYVLKAKQSVGDSYASSVPVVHGPYTANATRTLSFSKRKLVLHNVGNLPTGVYFCSVYMHQLKVKLPEGDGDVVGIAKKKDVSPLGYINYTLTGKGLGVSSNTVDYPDGKFLVVTTWQIIVNYNIMGQYMGGLSFPFPENSVVSIKYRYITY